VKLVWTREEDLGYGMFRPQAFQCLQAALDKDGKVSGWTHCVVGDGGALLQTGIRIPYYQVPNQFIESRGVSHGIRLKHWRRSDMCSTSTRSNRSSTRWRSGRHGPD
jgi:isoquinoline 1-oxidoreductase beta subunit